MDALLIAVTLVSLAVALVMSTVVWRTTREQKERAAARVAALAAAAASPQPAVDPPGAAPAPARPWRPASAATALPAGEASHLDAFSSEATLRRPGTDAGDVPLNAGFLGSSAPPAGGGASQRGLAVAAGVFAVLLATFAAVRLTDNGPAAAMPAAPLELLSLGHERQGAVLSVTGLVRNPASGTSVERVSAVVMLFDAQGALVTSATAPIDFMKLVAGDESPFVVRMQAPASVTRYRVSFRTGEGGVPHVDRREEGVPVALTRG